jgi:uncharacterized iron-regulated membrane protein
MSGTLGLIALLFAVVVTIVFAWAMWDGDRRAHQRKLESIQRRIEERQAKKNSNASEPDSAESESGGPR